MQNPVKKYLFILLAAAGLAVGAVPLLFGNLSCSGSSLSENSKTSECSRNIQDALAAFKNDMDMPYKINPDDYKLVFETGEIEKDYYRDGVKITASFNLSKRKDGCHLKFYKRGKSEPGSYESTSGSYGVVKLENCECM